MLTIKTRFLSTFYDFSSTANTLVPKISTEAVSLKVLVPCCIFYVGGAASVMLKERKRMVTRTSVLFFVICKVYRKFSYHVSAVLLHICCHTGNYFPFTPQNLNLTTLHIYVCIKTMYLREHNGMFIFSRILANTDCVT